MSLSGVPFRSCELLMIGGESVRVEAESEYKSERCGPLDAHVEVEWMVDVLSDVFMGVVLIARSWTHHAAHHLLLV